MSRAPRLFATFAGVSIVLAMGSAIGNSGRVQATGVAADPLLGPQTSLDAVSCASAGHCTAVGTVWKAVKNPANNISPIYVPVVATEEPGGWNAIVLPAFPTSDGGDGFSSVSCPSATS